MPDPLSQTIQESVDKVHTAAEFLHDVATGPASGTGSTVTNPEDQTEQKTVAKAIADIQNAANYLSAIAKDVSVTELTEHSNARPVVYGFYWGANPAQPLEQTTDFHGIDIVVDTDDDPTNLNGAAHRLYPFESTSTHRNTGTLYAAVSSYFLVRNVSSGTITNSWNQRFWLKNESTGTIDSGRYITMDIPQNLGGGTISSFTGIHIPNFTGVVPTANGLYIENPNNHIEAAQIQTVDVTDKKSATNVETVKSLVDAEKWGFFDDFLGGSLTVSGAVGEKGWDLSVTGTGILKRLFGATHLGQIYLDAPASGDKVEISLPVGISSISAQKPILTAGIFPATLTGLKVFVGLSDNNTAARAGLYCDLASNPNWQAYNHDGTTETLVDTGIAVTVLQTIVKIDYHAGTLGIYTKPGISDGSMPSLRAQVNFIPDFGGNTPMDPTVTSEYSGGHSRIAIDYVKLETSNNVIYRNIP